MEKEKRIWTMKDMCLVAQTVDFGEPVTKKRAIKMWLEEEYLDIIDMKIEETHDNYGAK